MLNKPQTHARVSVYGSFLAGERTAYTSIPTFLGAKHNMLGNGAVFWLLFFVSGSKRRKSQRCCCFFGVVGPQAYTFLVRARA